VFRPCFIAPVWHHVLVLVAGAVLVHAIDWLFRFT
jgi:hypothetical protein